MTCPRLGRAAALCALLAACTGPEPTPTAPDPSPPAAAEPAPPPVARERPPPVAPESVVGKVVTDLDVERWVQGDAALGGTQLVVFWEVWCRYCRQEVPKLQEWHDRLGPDGLQVVGLTRMSKGVTEDKVTEFLAEQGIAYPIGLTTGALGTELAVEGIPAAAVLVDGKVVWRGHPKRLDEETLRGWLTP